MKLFMAIIEMNIWGFFPRVRDLILGRWKKVCLGWEKRRNTDTEVFYSQRFPIELSDHILSH